MRVLSLILFLSPSFVSLAQTVSEEEKFISRLKPISVPPADLLSSRSVVLFSPGCTQKELEEIQTRFQQIGIDAVSYIEAERALAGHDLMNAFAGYFINREIRFLLFIKKNQDQFEVNFVPFNAKFSWIEPDQTSWSVRATNLQTLLQTIFRGVNGSQKRQNFLVNDFPERSGPVSAVAGRREEDWAPTLRVFKTAIPRMGDPESDKELEDYLKDNFHAKYELVDQDANEKDLVEKHFVYLLRFIHAPGSIAKDVLGYDMSKSESALATVNYPNGTLQLKTIPSGDRVYKFYLRNIEDDIYFLGRKWDADVTWQAALKNYFDGAKAAGKLN